MFQSLRFRRISALILPLLLALAVLFGGCAAETGTDASSAASSGALSAVSSTVEIPLVSTDTSDEPMIYISCTEEDLHRGDLILVNGAHTYDASTCEEEITSVRLSRVTDIQEGTYQLPIGKRLLQTMESMQTGLQNAMNDNVCLLINDSYRSAEAQQATIDEYLALYGQAYVDKYVAPVGMSEHHTALAVDMSFIDLPTGTVMATTSAEAAAHYKWVLDNCPKYGLILRYPPEKAEETGYSAESWHFRYVGIPHAEFITSHSLILEEYLALLQTTSPEQQLSIETEDGGRYSVYYIAATPGGTQVPVPESKPYTISGNNEDGFIVTVAEAGE